MAVFCGIDWAERHHDVALIDEDGQLVARRRIKENAEGLGELTRDARRCRRPPPKTRPGRDRDPPRPAGRRAARHRPPGLRDQPDGRRPLPRPVPPARKQVRPRRRDGPGQHPAHRRRHAPPAASRHRARAGHRGPGPRAPGRHLAAHRTPQELRSLLREYYPALLAGVRRHSAREPGHRRPPAVLAIAPDPGRRRRPQPQPQIAAALRRARPPAPGRRHRHRASTPCAGRSCATTRWSRTPWAPRRCACWPAWTPPAPTSNDLGQAPPGAFRQHPDYAIITSFPGLADLSGARILAEIGDSRARFADARDLKAYAGSAPITRASGRTTTITRRRIKNNRLAAAGFIWAFMAITNSPAARAHYDRRRAIGDRHAAALRHLFNRYLGQLSPLPRHRPGLRPRESIQATNPRGRLTPWTYRRSATAPSPGCAPNAGNPPAAACASSPPPAHGGPAPGRPMSGPAGWGLAGRCAVSR